MNKFLAYKIFQVLIAILLIVFFIPNKAIAAQKDRIINAENLIVHMACIQTLSRLDQSGDVFVPFSIRKDDELNLIFGQLPSDNPICGSMTLATQEEAENIKIMMSELQPAVTAILNGVQPANIDPAYFLNAVDKSILDKVLKNTKSNVTNNLKSTVADNENKALVYARLAESVQGMPLTVGNTTGGVGVSGGGSGTSNTSGLGGAGSQDGQGSSLGLGADKQAGGASISGATGSDSAASSAGSVGVGSPSGSSSSQTTCPNGTTLDSTTGNCVTTAQGCSSGQIEQDGKCVTVPVACQNFSGVLLQECICVNKNPPGAWNPDTLSCNEVGGDTGGDVDNGGGDIVIPGGDTGTGGGTGSDNGSTTQEDNIDEFGDGILDTGLPGIPDLGGDTTDNFGGSGSGSGQDQGDTSSAGAGDESSGEGSSSEGGFNEEDFFGGAGTGSSGDQSGGGSGSVSGGGSSSSPASGGLFENDGTNSPSTGGTSGSGSEQVICNPGTILNPNTGQCELCQFNNDGATQAGCANYPPLNAGNNPTGGSAALELCTDPSDPECVGGSVSSATGDILASLQVQTNQAVQEEIFSLLPPSPVYTYRGKAYNVRANASGNIELSNAAQSSWNAYDDTAKQMLVQNGNLDYSKQFEISDKSCILGNIAYPNEDGVRVNGINPKPEVLCNAHSKMWELAVKDALDYVAAKVDINNKLDSLTSSNVNDVKNELYNKKYLQSLSSSQRELLGYRLTNDDYDAIGINDNYEQAYKDDFFTTTSGTAIKNIFDEIANCNDIIKKLEARIAQCLVFGSESAQSVTGACKVGEVTTCKIMRMQAVNRAILNKLAIDECLNAEFKKENGLSSFNCTSFTQPSTHSCQQNFLTPDEGVACNF